jgi:hypothetical protein
LVDQQIVKSYTNLLSILDFKLIIPRNLSSRRAALPDCCGVGLASESRNASKKNKIKLKPKARFGRDTVRSLALEPEQQGDRAKDGEIARTGN